MSTFPSRPVVCLDCVTARDRGAFMGNLVHARELARSLAARSDIALELLVDRHTLELFEELGLDADLVPCIPPRKNKLTDQLAIWRALVRTRPALYHKPNGQLPLVPIPCRAVVTIADLNFKHLPTGRLARLYKEFGYRRSVRRAQRVICVSRFTESEVHRFYPASCSKTTVIHHGTNPFPAPDTRLASRLPGRWFLTFGHHRHKNVDVCLRALRSLDARREGREIGLVVVGSGRHIDEVIRPEAARLGLDHRVFFVGSVSDAELHALYRRAIALLFMSRHEGFGLPLLEAMQSGCPAIASDVCSLPEVAGDAAVLLPPDDSEALAGAMSRMISDADWRRGLVSRGLVRAARFSWDAAADATIAVYREVLELPPVAVRRREQQPA